VPDAETYRALAESSWAWVLAQVRHDEVGPWIPEKATESEPGEFRFGMHSGVDGLAHVLAEIRLTRDLTAAEAALGDEIAALLVARAPDETEFDYFGGLASTVGVLVALDAPGAELAVARLAELATPDGWPTSFLEPPRAVKGAPCNDATLGTASVVLGAVWALRHRVPGAAAIADHAVGVLTAEQVEVPTGLDWRFVPERFVIERRSQMPNWSHGLAGVAGSLAAAGVALDRPELVEAARLGAEHLVTLGDTSDGGLRVPHIIPGNEDIETFTYSWCHGPAGTSLLFAALDRAGVPAVAGRTPYDWERACLHSLRTSGIPERLHPGFWDNDGRCCGTAGVGDVVLSMWQRHGHDDELAFAVTLADALVERSISERSADGVDHTYWRFVEHRNDDPLLPPGVGWMQGVAGIAAYLFRIARVLEQGRTAPAVARMDTWWSLPAAGD
jgi:lantibiotic modifying enzyme